MDITSRVRVLDNETVYDGWSSFNRATFDYQHRNGTWQTQTRDIFDCGHGAALLPYDLERRTVILVRQFRYAAFSEAYTDLLLETPAGLLDDASPEERIVIEVEEETGYRVSDVTKVFECFVSPGAVTQKIHCFVAPYRPGDRVSEGGGLTSEGEDIEVLEMDFDEAYAMIADARIQDCKTIMLLQYAALNLFNAKGAAGT
ncbi:NUDIX domain-containing protein [Hoeflea prorocentri]|uniref:GDP-mannose pyrophosphatase n=1 Tax=Hoeflea prorocentri TaxID=1922333 RepID=A0A9X3UHT8_9HYPH|nr:NUDIX domain-containing protein [Hoeflea prorocentri]MCY6381085.1 GDP-mannose pyrophosphatase [Hoeflea prorocentri]MDA5398885.1 GDP-mannose pyrophosphatase [Hoeflea prorocentri]